MMLSCMASLACLQRGLYASIEVLGRVVGILEVLPTIHLALHLADDSGALTGLVLKTIAPTGKAGIDGVRNIAPVDLILNT